MWYVIFFRSCEVTCLFPGKNKIFIFLTLQGTGFSLSVFSADQMLKMGTSTDYGVCKGKRKDGLPCTLVINKYVSASLKSCYFLCEDEISYKLSLLSLPEYKDYTTFLNNSQENLICNLNQV